MLGCEQAIGTCSPQAPLCGVFLLNRAFAVFQKIKKKQYFGVSQKLHYEITSLSLHSTYKCVKC